MKFMEDLKANGWFGAAAGFVTAAVTLVAGVIGLWVMFENKIEDSVKQSVEVVSLEVQRSTRDVVDVLTADMLVRQRVLDREIESLQRVHEPSVEQRLELDRKKSSRDDIANQIHEIEKKWP